jgi:hypothetical protein
MLLPSDGCDATEHQRCAGVTRVPKGDWFCGECKADKAAKAKAGKSPAAKKGGGATARGQLSKKAVEEADEDQWDDAEPTDDEDDLSDRCRVCLGPDSEENNLILLCDKCDMPVSATARGMHISDPQADRCLADLALDRFTRSATEWSLCRRAIGSAMPASSRASRPKLRRRAPRPAPRAAADRTHGGVRRGRGGR